MRKRLTIFCLYNENGTVEQYVCDLLEQITIVSERIIIVINGEINTKSRERLKQYSNEIIQRENKGFDQGAYKDILNDYLNLQELKEYDDLIFCNDTFYGFFTPLKQIFNQMENKSLDIWGLNIIDRILIRHIQSYFLVFNGSGITAVYNYLKNTTYASSYGEAVAILETGLLIYIEEKGLNYSAFVDVKCTDVYTNPYDCVSKYGLPIIKRKCWDSKECNPVNLLATIDYIKANFNYNYSLPELTDEKSNNVKPRTLAKSLLSEDELIAWANEGDFYIFGAGKIAQIIYYTYFSNNKNFKGFTVTDTSKQFLPTVSYRELSKDARVLIGVAQEHQEEIYNMLPNSMKKIRLWKLEDK